MPSILWEYDQVEFICGRPFLYNGHEYSLGDDVPAAKGWHNLESLIRSRRLVPVVDDTDDKPLQFHREVKTRSLALRKMGLGDTKDEPASVEPVAEGEWDPGKHSQSEVLDYVDEYPDELLSVYALEEQGKARSTLLKELDARLNKAAEEEDWK